LDTNFTKLHELTELIHQNGTTFVIIRVIGVSFSWSGAGL